MSNLDFLQLLDQNIARKFVQLVTGQNDPVIRVRVIHDQKKNEPSGEASGTVAELWPHILANQEHGLGVFWLPNLCGFQCDGFAKDVDATGFPALFVDHDAGLPNEWHRRPDIIVHTGIKNGVQRGHSYWLITPGATPDEWEQAQRRLIAHYPGGDPAIKNPSRLMRLPGTLHMKAEPRLVTFTSGFDPDDRVLFGLPTIAKVLAGVPDMQCVNERRVSASSGAPVAEKILCDALSYLDPNEARDGWRDTIAAIRAANVPGDDSLNIRRTIALDWSRGELDRLSRYKDALPSRYTSDDDVDKVFNSMPPKIGGITVGTVFEKARNAGWKGNPFDNSIFAGETSSYDKSNDDGRREFQGLGYYIGADVRSKKIDWIWPWRFATGMVGIIAGHPDTGKSTVGYDCAARITNGADWPFGEGTAEQGAVIIVSGEDSRERIIKPRLTVAGANMDQIIFVEPTVRDQDTQRRRMLSLGDDLANLAGLIEKLRKEGRIVKMVIIDPISAYLGNKDSYKNAEMRALLTPLAEWAEKVQIAIFVVTHLTKDTKGKGPLASITDSLAIGALSRTAWLTAPEKDGEGNLTGRMFFMKAKNNISPPNVSNLAYRIKGVVIRLDDGSEKEQPRIEWAGYVAATADEVLNSRSDGHSKIEEATDFLGVLLEGGPVPVNEIAERAKGKHNWATVRRAKAKLKIKSVKSGFTDAQWMWVLPGTKVNGIDVDDPDFDLLCRDTKNGVRP